MKGAILLLLLTFSSVVSATTYYVSTTGNDNNPGTISQPWLTWQKAFSTANAGDIVYFRGGVYRPAKAAYWNNITMIDPNDGIGHNGTKANPICYYNYPGETPILDCSLIRSSGNFNTGINIDNAEFIKFKGLTVRNVYQRTSNVSVCGINAYNCSNFTFENMSVHNLGGRAFYYESSAWQASIAYDTTRFINCDMYNCLDSLGYAPGNMADGIKGHMYPKCYTYFEGCRVWNCSDDGFDLSGSGVAVFKKCWAWDLGSLEVGNGSGFKIGAVGDSVSYPTRIVTNCLAAWCTNSIGVASGFGEIDFFLDASSYYRVNARIYNNTAYKNDLGFSAGNHPNKNFRNSIYRNNISYMSGFIQDAVRYNVLLMGHWYPESNNTWDFYNPLPGSMPPWFIETDTVTVTDADFVSVDSTGISGPRKSDGSLPDINFLKLRSTSDLIDAGTQIPSSDGVDFLLQYSGLSPDIGYSEYSGTNTTPKPVTSITVTGAGGATTITTNRGTLQLSAAILPSDASNKTVKWSITNGTGQGTINSTGLVTAVANGTVIARATANDGSGVYGTLTITISNQVIAVSGITVTGAGGATTITTDKGTLQLSAAVLPANATNKTVTWSLTNGTGQGTINSAGLVTAVANGTVTARATANDGSGVYGTLTITISNQVISVTGIAVTGAGGATLITTIGGTLQLSAAVLPANATNKTVTWSLTNGTGQATINSTGLVTAVAYGTVTARATANDGSGVYGTLTITISNQVIAVTGITVSGAGGATTITTNSGTLQLSAAVLPANATIKTVTWSLTNGTGQSTINSTGLVTAAANGTVTARATANDGSGVYGTLTITISNQVIPVTGITVTGAGGATTITTDNGTLQLTTAVLPANATNKTVTWSIVSGTERATISLTGLVTAIDDGTITVRATANDGSGVYGTLVITISNNGNSPPVIIVNYKSSSYSGFVSEINASGSYDANKDNLTYSWAVPDNVSVSSATGSTIKYLGPIVSSNQTVEFTLSISDGKTTQNKVIPIEILPYKPELEVAEISNIEASSFQSPYYPYNIIDGNIGTMWSADGDNQWLIIELKHSFLVQHVKLAFQPGQRRESYFDILGSVDKVTWEPILNKFASCDFSGDLQVFEFPPSKTGKEFKYIKVIGLGNSTDTWNYISELKIFGYRYRNSDYEKLPVKIYPNPAKEHITLKIDDPTLTPDFIQITHITGAVIMRGELDPDIRELSIPIDLKNGVYIIQLGSGKLTMFTQKLVVSK